LLIGHASNSKIGSLVALDTLTIAERSDGRLRASGTPNAGSEANRRGPAAAAVLAV
jgi:hypothetical protein